jgi:hypothetical protein
LIARRGKSDVGGAFHVGDRVAGGAAHGDSGVDVLPCGLVVVALETFGGIFIGGEKDGMLVKVGASRRSEKQQDESNRECGEKNEAMARVRERHGAPFAESEDFVCRFLAFQHVLVIVGAKNCCASCLYHVYVRGEVYLAAGQGTQAAVEFQKIIDHSGIVWNCWKGALAHLGRTSQGADADAARVRALAAYKDFLTLWKDADPDIPILKEAKAEYAKLQ